MPSCDAKSWDFCAGLGAGCEPSLELGGCCCCGCCGSSGGGSSELTIAANRSSSFATLYESLAKDDEGATGTGGGKSFGPHELGAAVKELLLDVLFSGEALMVVLWWPIAGAGLMVFVMVICSAPPWEETLMLLVMVLVVGPTPFARSCSHSLSSAAIFFSISSFEMVWFSGAESKSTVACEAVECGLTGALCAGDIRVEQRHSHAASAEGPGFA